MLLNSVYQDSERGILFRIVYQSSTYLWIMDLSKEAPWPELIKLFKFEDLVCLEIYKKVEDPFRREILDLSEHDIRIRDEAFNAIELFLDGTDTMFIKIPRSKLIKEAVERSGKSRNYIVRQLKRYWQRGLSRNALLPDLRNCGAKGVSRRNGEIKTGKKRIYSEGEGIIVTDDIAAMFKTVIEKFYLKNKKMSFTQAYRNHLIGIYRSQYPFAGETEVPTYSQFKYYFNRHYKSQDVVRKRTDSKEYDKDIRALSSTSTFLNIGPGGRYEIDATIGDIYLISKRDPEKIIGRPVIYYVRDVFSRMITGLYVGLENASWVTAMIALANAFTDKVDFCAKYGITITSDEWPCFGIPASIMADKGELLSKQADALVNAFDIQLSNSRSYRGDDKGGVENLFLTTQAEWKPYADAVVEPFNGKKRTGKDYRLDATMNIDQFTKMMITIVLQKNHNNVVKGYDFSEDMPDDLAAVPIDLWNWGIKYRTGRLKPYENDIVYVNLLPTAKGTVSEEGIGFKGMRFSCSEALRRGWFDRFRQTRPKNVVIAFDPRSTNTIYLRPNNDFNDYWICKLSDKSRRFKNMTFAEAAAMLKGAKTSEAKATQRKNYLTPEFHQEISGIIEESREQKLPVSHTTKSDKLKGIRENRKEEKFYERSALYDETDEQIENENIHHLYPEEQNDDDYSYPSFDDYFEDDDD